MLNYDFDLVVSEPSDNNTNSTTLFSDDTDDKSKRSTIQETGISVQQEQEVSVKKQYLNNATIYVSTWLMISLENWLIYAPKIS